MWYLFLLALVQGTTEFLPISSSAHLTLVDVIFNRGESPLDIMIALHLGSLIALLIYYYSDIKYMYKQSIVDRVFKNNLFIKVLIAFLPTVFVGGILMFFYPAFFKNPMTIALTTLIFALVLWYFDRKPQENSVDDVSYKQAFVIGLWQVLSLIPGVSRSGITISAARKYNITREESIHFSMLLGVPTIISVAFVSLIKVLSMDNFDLSTNFVVGTFFSALISYVVLKLFIKLIRKISFNFFVVYRLILAGVLFYGMYVGWLKF